MDILTRTSALILTSILLIHLRALWPIAVVFVLLLSVAMATHLNKVLIFLAATVPVIPITLSHLLIEPFFTTGTVDQGTLAGAAVAWFRVSSLALASLAWLTSLETTEAAQLCNVIFLGQYAFLPFLVAGSFLGVLKNRWVAATEVQSLWSHGCARHRRPTQFSRLPSLALQLVLASLISSNELALSCSGRGIGTHRIICVHRPKFTPVGIILVGFIGGVVFVSIYQSW